MLIELFKIFKYTLKVVFLFNSFLVFTVVHPESDLTLEYIPTNFTSIYSIYKEKMVENAHSFQF